MNRAQRRNLGIRNGDVRQLERAILRANAPESPMTDRGLDDLLDKGILQVEFDDTGATTSFNIGLLEKMVAEAKMKQGGAA
jgi:hypothetical protein